LKDAGRGFRTSDFDFALPPHLIAQHPLDRRDASRLLVVDRGRQALEHRRFVDIEELIQPGDVLVLNDTRVIPARLRGTRSGGGEAEVLLLNPVEGDDTRWTALVRPGAKIKPGRVVQVSPELEIEVEEALPGGERIVRLLTDLSVDEALDRHGEVPLPPYMRREPSPADRERYQTVYARESGSVAAPTAGLHFTPELLGRLAARGVEVAMLLLHVGAGTFRPVDAEDPAEHIMHAERYEVTNAAAEAINAARARGGSVWAVGTTTIRTLETVAADPGIVVPGSGWTDIFIRPPHRFRVANRLITNFHLPRSTLLMLVSAFGGYELMMRAYREAVAREYRFYSYGDAMVIT
jgi:S-adenosylmethionine:tRNA ribosyltransferase-isomerase